MLTKHQIEDYNKNGFIVIEELLSKNEIRQTRHIIDQFIEKSRDCLLYTSPSPRD